MLESGDRVGLAVKTFPRVFLRNDGSAVFATNFSGSAWELRGAPREPRPRRALRFCTTGKQCQTSAGVSILSLEYGLPKQREVPS